MKLTLEQDNAIRKLLRFESNVQTLGGYAGTGKTTVISQLINDLPNFAVCAFTGKAANVLRNKGIRSASTIHSLIYKPQEDAWGNVTFQKIDEVDCNGFIVDEASMVGEQIHADLLSFGKPIIYVGDHGQLEPVNSKHNLMEKPDIRLEQIHRNAGEIAWFANHLRNGGKASSWADGGEVHIIDRDQWLESAMSVSQVICAFNKTRAAVNRRIRAEHGLPDYLQAGDRVMCLKNRAEIGVFNGMQGRSFNVNLSCNSMVFDYSDGRVYVDYDPKTLNAVKYQISHEKFAPLAFDYCYAITCHKAQGDEWDTGLVIEEECELWSHARWAYTAASRFRNQVNWICKDRR